MTLDDTDKTGGAGYGLVMVACDLESAFIIFKSPT